MARILLPIFSVVAARIPDAVHVGLRGSRAANRMDEVQHVVERNTSEMRLLLDRPQHPATTCKVGDAVTCSDGIAFCAGYQCCPDGTACPSAAPGWAACPAGRKADCTATAQAAETAAAATTAQPTTTASASFAPPQLGTCSVDEPVFCSDGVAKCQRNQCCPDGTACPSAATGWSQCPAGRVADCTTAQPATTAAATTAQPATTAAATTAQPATTASATTAQPTTTASASSPPRQPSGAKPSAMCSIITDRSRRQLVLKNSCSSDRVFQFNWHTTPAWVPRPADLGSSWHNQYLEELTTMSCPVGKQSCDGLRFADGQTTNSIFGTTACVAGRCVANPYFNLVPGDTHTIDLVENWESATMSLAMDCDSGRYNCQTGGPNGGLFEFTYASEHLWYDTSAVDGWSKASDMAATICAVDSTPVNVTRDGFWCGVSQCSFDPSSHCPDGSDVPDPDYYVPGDSYNATAISLLIAGVGLDQQAKENCVIAGCHNYQPHTFNGGFDNHINNRMYICGTTDGAEWCVKTKEASKANMCRSGCMDCQHVTKKDARSEECTKYCCPDHYSPHFGPNARFDSATCSAIGVQKSTDYSRKMARFCPNTYSYGYNDHSSTYVCHNSVSLVIEACPTR